VAVIKRVNCIDGPVRGDQYWDPDTGRILFVEGSYVYRMVDLASDVLRKSRPDVTYVTTEAE